MKRTLAVCIAFLHLAVFAVPSFSADYTQTVCPSGCDQTTLNAAVTWFESNHSNLVTETKTGEIVISGDWTSSPDTTAVGIDAITTSPTYDLTIYTTGDARHDGTYDGKASAYRLQLSGSVPIYITSQGINIDGLLVRATASSGNIHGIHYVAATGTDELNVSNTIVKGVYSGTVNFTYGIYIGGADPTAYLWNDIVYDIVNGSNTSMVGISVNNASANAYLFNNTVHNSYVGVKNWAGTVTGYNNGAASCTTAFDGTIGGSNNLSSSPTFVDVGNDDFHLDSSDSTWLGQGTDTPSGYKSDTDIDGETRTSTWDVGADEYVAAAGGGQVIIFMSWLTNFWRLS